MNRYQDMLSMQPPPLIRMRMKRGDRAKLFAPFAALSGHEESVHQRDRVLSPPLGMTAHSQDILDRKLRRIRKGDTVTAVYFVPVKRDGQTVLGEYHTLTDRVSRLDIYEQVLQLGMEQIYFEDLADLRGQGLEVEDG